MTSEVFRLLQQQLNEDMYKRLLVYASRRALLYGWSDGLNQLLPGRSFTIDDIVSEAIKRTVNGKRRWDPSKSPLFYWLKYQVNSVMDAWIKSKEGKHEISFSDDEPDQEYDGSGLSVRLDDVINPDCDTPEEILINRQISLVDNNMMSLAFQAIADDPELVELYEAICNTGDHRPRILAAELNTTITDINNRNKRWFRRMTDLRASEKGTVQ